MTEPHDPTEMAGIADADTESAFAWALDDEPDEPPPRFTPGRITALAVAGCVVVIAVATGVAVHHLTGRSSPVAATASTESSPPPAIASVAPVEPGGIDGDFVRQMRGFGVPVSDDDPQWIVDLARATCTTAVEGGETDYPPGASTVTNLVETAMNMNPDWTRQQASRFINGTINQYCPRVRGLSQDEMAALPDDERYLALLQDRIGITPMDGDNSLIRVGYQVCDWSAQGWSVGQMVEGINSNNPPEDERVIIEAAVDVYCPEFKPR